MNSISDTTNFHSEVPAVNEQRSGSEQALREQADLLNLTHDAIFVMDLTGVLTYWNRAAEVQYGWTAEQALGRIVHDLLKTIFPAPLEVIKAELLRAGRWEGELVHTKKDGTQVVVASRWALKRDKENVPLRILETNNDITERKRTEETIRENEKQFERERERLKLLLEFTNTVASNLELQEVFRATSANLRRVMKLDSVWINVADAEGENMHVLFQDFPNEKGYFDKVLVPLKGSINEKVFLKGKPMVVHDLEEIRIYPEEYRRAVAEGVQCACLLPLISRKRIVGVLSLARLTNEAFEEEEVDFLLQVANQLALAIENALVYEQTTALKDKLAREKLYLEDELRSHMDFQEIIGRSSVLLHVLQQVETVAPTDSTVLILGETGTGKELIARAIHNHSRRKDRTFVKLNCAAIPTGLLESELFGHVKGAFTGAIGPRIGRLELADQGTMFLDEIGDISLELQSKLLRALQEREFERLGSSKTLKVDVRLIVATNRDLQKMVADGQFRSDLFYRLNVFPIRIPPLRERTEDIPLLVRYFAEKYARRMEKRIESIPSNAMKKLQHWHWPGNIRELENFIERSVILTRGSILSIPMSELSDTLPTSESNENMSERIIRTLKETKGRVGGLSGAATRLGIKRTTLIAQMKKFGINPRQFS